MSEAQTLRSLTGEIIVIECKSCRLHGELVRNALVTKFKASITLRVACRSICLALRVTGRSRARWQRRGWRVGAPAPFVFATAMENLGIAMALFVNALLGTLGIAVFMGGGCVYTKR